MGKFHCFSFFFFSPHQKNCLLNSECDGINVAVNRCWEMTIALGTIVIHIFETEDFLPKQLIIKDIEHHNFGIQRWLGKGQLGSPFVYPWLIEMLVVEVDA